MPYIGRELDRGNYLKLDDISSSFDGSTTTFNLTNGGNAFYPGSAFSILVVLAGVVQEPEAAYQINQSQITFASAPLAGDQFFCIVLGQALGVNTPANGSVNGAQLAKPFNYDNYFYLDDANNRVGVGTASPMTPLHVEGTGRFTDLTVTGDLTVEGTTSTLDTVVTEVDKLEVAANNSTVGVAITQSGTGDILNLYDGGTEVFSVTDGGKVSIGSGAWPGAQGLYLGDAGHIYSVGTNSLYTNQNLYYNSGWKYNGNSAGTQLSMVGGVVSFSNAPVNSSGAGAAATLTERLRISSNGQVGINTTTPAEKLDVWGTIRASAGTQQYMHMYPVAGAGYFDVSNSTTYPSIVFRQTGSSGTQERLRIDSSGNVGIGTNTISDNLEVFAPTNASLQIKGGAAGSDSSRSAQLKLLASGSKLYTMESDASDGSFRILDSSTERFRITSTGYVGIGTNIPSGRLHLYSGTTSPTKLIIQGDGSSTTAAALVLQSSDETANWRATGTFYYDTESDVEWFSGRPYSSTDAFSINRRTSIGGAFGNSTANSSNSLLLLDSSGNLGIGTDNPDTQLQVFGSSTTGNLKIGGGNGAGNHRVFISCTETNSYIDSYGNNAYGKLRINAAPLILNDSGGGSVGISTTNPRNSAKLDVHNSTASGVYINYDGKSNTEYGLRIESNAAGGNFESDFANGTTALLDLYANSSTVTGGDLLVARTQSSTPVLLVRGNGNFGIGISPTARLDVRRDASTAYDPTDDDAQRSNTSTISIRNEDGTTNSFAQLTFDTAGTNQSIARIVAIRSGTGSNDLAFVTEHSNTKAERLRIKSDGKVGIGTDNPDNLLHLLGNTPRIEIQDTAGTGNAARPGVFMTDSAGSTLFFIGNGGTGNSDLTLTNYQTADIKFRTQNIERLRITSSGDVGIGTDTPTSFGPTLQVAGTDPALLLQDTATAVDYFGVNVTSGITQLWYDDAAALTINTATAISGSGLAERLRITSGGDVGIGVDPSCRLQVKDTATHTAYASQTPSITDCTLALVNNPSSEAINNHATIQFNVNGGTYNRVCSISAVAESASNRYSSLTFCTDDAGNRVEKLRITSGGEVNIGGSDMTQTVYTFQVSKDLGTPSSSGTGLVRFKNANSTYSQDLNLLFNNSKDIIWTGGSGNGGMTWDMGTRGYNWQIGGTNKFAVGNSNATLNGTTDGVLNMNTTDGRGSFIRFQENGTTKVWVGSAEGMGVGDQDDACLMSVDNVYFRNSTDSRTTLTVTREGRLSGYKAWPDASGTLRSNDYFPPTNHYLTYSAPSGGNKWMRFGYFGSRGRYRITFNSTGGYYSPGSVTFDFQLYWTSPHVYVGNISKLSSQYVTQFRVTTDSNGNNYYGEVYVSVNANQTGSHIYCTAQVLGTADREFNLHNYGYDLSNLTYTSSNISL